MTKQRDSADNTGLPKQITQMLLIAERAIEADKQDQAAQKAKSDLTTAYRAFKTDRGIEKIERDTPEWEQMMKATRSEYVISETEKSEVKNAKRRLKTAIDGLTKSNGGPQHE